MASHGRYGDPRQTSPTAAWPGFLAVQHGAEGFEKPVVLKRILTQFSADPQFRNMLPRRGAHLDEPLQHSNIAQVLDLGVADWGEFF